MLVSCQCLPVITVVIHIQLAWHMCGPANPGLHKEHHGIDNCGVRGSNMDSDNCRKMYLIGTLRLRAIK